MARVGRKAVRKCDVTEATSLAPLLLQALEHVPASDRQLAAKVAVLLQAGYGEREAAGELGMSWSDLVGLRESLQGGVIESLRADGYSDAEIQRYLCVASTIVGRHRATFDLGPTLETLFRAGP